MSVFAGYFGQKLLIENSLGFNWSDIIFIKSEEIFHMPFMIAIIPILFSIFGILIAYKMYFKDSNLSSKLINLFGKVHKFFMNAWFVDNLFKIIFIDPLISLSKILSNFFERKLIEGFWFDCSQKISFNVASFLRQRLQTGYLYDYVTLMLVGTLICLLSYSIYLLNLLGKI
jgi:NADH-quinone oxidoreductase subunit L